MKFQLNIKILIYLFFMIIVSLTLQSQTVTDYDGNVYQTVAIGNQIWMADNLRVTHYSDGTPIIDGTGIGVIINLPHEIDSTKRYFYYNDDTAYANQYGCLYSWYAAVRGSKGSNNNPSGIQGICPTGWHIPSDKEWTELELFLGMSPSDTSIWYERGTNQGDMLKISGSTGFNAYLGGNRDYDDFASPNVYFHGKDTEGNFITSTVAEQYCLMFVIKASSSQTFRWDHNKCCGYSVRCLKDSPTTFKNYLKNNSIYTLYPNPCKDYLFVNSKQLIIEKIDLFSLDGKLIKSILLKGKNKISVSDIDKGFYLIKIYSGNNVFVDKVIIE